MDGEPEDEEVRPEEVLNVTTPSTKEWEEFWQTVDTLKVWSWEKEYINSDIIDGTEWELRIKREGRRRRRISGLLSIVGTSRRIFQVTHGVPRHPETLAQSDLHLTIHRSVSYFSYTRM